MSNRPAHKKSDTPLVAGFLGFFGIAGLSASIAKILFIVFIVLFIASLIFGRRRL